MPAYSYIAKSFKGETKSGVLEAKDEHELVKILHGQGFVLIKVKTADKKKGTKDIKINIPFLNRVKLSEKILFTRNLRVMISAGISLSRSLRILALQSRSEKFANVLTEITEKINKGKGFAEALSCHPDVFSDLFFSMVKVGEESGTLEEVLDNLTCQMEREQTLRSNVIGALIYPAVIIVAMTAIGFLMLIMIVPQLANTFEDMGADLPATTQFIINFGNFLATKWFLFILGMIVSSWIFQIFLKTAAGKKMMSAFLLKVPVISTLVKKINSAYIVRTLSSLTASGVPIIRALEIISDAVGNFYFKESIIEAIKKVEKGSKLSEALKPYQNIYPFMVIQMLEVGEESGQTSEVLAKLADFFEEEVAMTTKNLSAVIEPVLMLVVGGAVGFFAISMIQPMYSMLQYIE
ncbi:type II secretion system F family protein [Candidatus Parcubacteria bacterium]|nr:type II secretion system F family protein [Candidatus Parcubacteria bacterium]